MLDYTTFTTVMEINKNLTKSNNKTYIANIHMYSILRFTFLNKLLLDVFYLLKSLSINLKGLMGKYRNSKAVEILICIFKCQRNSSRSSLFNSYSSFVKGCQ